MTADEDRLRFLIQDTAHAADPSVALHARVDTILAGGQSSHFAPRTAVVVLLACTLAIAGLIVVRSTAPRQQALPPVAGSLVPNASLADVSCGSTGLCVAVGKDRDGSTATAFAVAYRDGAWGVDNPPAIPGQSYLASVSCAERWCMAVGGAISPSGTLDPLVEVWSGSYWRRETTTTSWLGTFARYPRKGPCSPPTCTVTASFSGVSCMSSKACVVVGTAVIAIDGKRQESGVTESWDGRGPVDLTGSVGGSLTSVSCIEPTTCAALGGYLVAHRFRPSSENIGSFGIADPPDDLDAIACLSPDYCLGAGKTMGTPGSPVALQFTGGSGWSTTFADSGSGLFSGVSCPAIGDCFVVGAQGSDSTTSAIAAVQAGTAWKRTTVALPAGSQSSALLGVSCVSRARCWAVGAAVFGNVTTPLVAEWMGRSFQAVQIDVK